MGENRLFYLLCVLGCCLLAEGDENNDTTSVNSTSSTTERKLVVESNDLGYKFPLKVLVVAGFLCVIVIAFFAIRYYRTQRRRKIVKRYNRVRTEGDHTAMEELAQSKDDSGPDSEIELFEKK
eukprot:Em0016g418a